MFQTELCVCAGTRNKVLGGDELFEELAPVIEIEASTRRLHQIILVAKVVVGRIKRFFR